jgi:hypothetical protein
MNRWQNPRHQGLLLSVVVDDFDSAGVVRLVIPNETNTPLPVNPNAVPPIPITFQRFQVITRRQSKIFDPYSSVQHLQLALSNPRAARGYLTGYVTLEQFLRLFAIERGDQLYSLHSI